MFEHLVWVWPTMDTNKVILSRYYRKLSAQKESENTKKWEVLALQGLHGEIRPIFRSTSFKNSLFISFKRFKNG